MISPSSSRADRPEPLTSDAVRSGLKTERFGRTLHVYDRIESTNTAALALADRGAPEGTVVLAESQSKGRGRRGREWISPPGVNLYFSIILRPSGDSRRVGLWTLAAAAAVAGTIRQTTGLPVRLKWPNDVRLNRKKVAGLLLEGGVYKAQFNHLILGVGINVNLAVEALPESLRASATSLREELGREVNRLDLFQRLMESLEHQYRSYLEPSPQKLLEAYTALSETLGETVAVLENDGEWTGRAIGLTEEGALILRGADDRERVIHAEAVVHLRGEHAAGD